MLPVNFQGSNLDLNKPPEMTDEECAAVRAFKGTVPERAYLAIEDGTEYPFILTAWMPSKEDLEALNAGRPLWLRVLSFKHPPVVLFTLNDNDEIN
jgi:hypothetical protein